MDSVTIWISRLKDSRREEAAEMLWNRYLDSLLRLARHKLGGTPRGAVDEEDVALDAFEALLRGVREDRFSQLNDRNDLWQILIMLTDRRAIGQQRIEAAEKRGGRLGRRELHEELQAPEATPELAAQLAEEFQRRLDQLPDPVERDIAIQRLQGYNNREIAERLGIGLRTVERKLNLIRRTWGA